MSRLKSVLFALPALSPVVIGGQVSAQTGTEGSQAPVGSREFRLTSPADRPLSYQVGAYAFREEIEYEDDRTVVNANRIFPDGSRLPPGVRSDAFFSQRTTSASVCGQVNWSVTEQLRLTGGARYSYDRKRGLNENIVTPGAPATFTASLTPYAAVNLRYSETKPTWLASVQYDLAPLVMLYGAYSTGWKAGGFNGRVTSPTSPFTFGPENSENFEVGMKSTFFDRRLLVNMTAYDMEVRGFQDSVLNPVTGVGFIVGNAGVLKTRGVDFDIQARPIEPLSLTLNGAYLNAEFQDYSAGPCPGGRTADGTRPNTCNFNGLTPGYSPRWRGSFGAEYTHHLTDELDLVFGADVSYSSRQHLSATLDALALQDEYTLVDARLALVGPSGKWRLALWGKNLTDEVYFTAIAPVSGGNFLSGGGRTGVNALIGWTGAPRTYGVEATMRF